MENIEERWCIVANIKQEIPFGPGGIESKSGIKKFKAGAKVSIVGSYAGTCTSIMNNWGQSKN
jgi:hypothetical protein